MQEGAKWPKVSSRKYAPKNLEAISGGTRPVSTVNPVVIEVMKEIDILVTKDQRY